MNNPSLVPESDLQLPQPPPLRGYYAPVVSHDSLVNGLLAYRGRLGGTIDDIVAGYQAARLCTLSTLAQIQRALVSYDAIVGIAK